MGFGPSQCARCARLHARTVRTPPITCQAFPDGIPHEVVFDEVDHVKPSPGDHGLQWTPAEKGGLHPRGPQFYDQDE